MDDTALLAQIAAGSQEAFKTFYQRYEQRLWNYLMKMIRVQTLVEELVIDVMLAVWRGAGGFRGASRVSTWVFGIARNKALDVLRRRSLPIDPIEELPQGLKAADSDPLEQVEEKERARQVRQALKTLSREHREVLELTFVRGLSYQEIGEIVGCPLNTVKTRAFYARRQLKQALEDLNPKEEQL